MVLEMGSLVLYGVHGVCRIVGTCTRVIDRKKVEYYVLEPLEQSETKFYLPMHNPAAVSKLRKLLTKEELDALLASEDVRRDNWIEDENRRKLLYRDLINGGDRTALISMVGSLHAHREAQLAAGRKFHLCDENFLRDSEKLLSAEFSLVLGIPKEQIGEYIQNALKKF